MKIGIKYCGGCKTTYNRVEHVNKLINDFPENNFEPVDDKVNHDIILVVNGCKTACANHEALIAKKKNFLNSFEDFEKLRISKLLK